jgi:hypothetical protein
MPFSRESQTTGVALSRTVSSQHDVRFGDLGARNHVEFRIEVKSNLVNVADHWGAATKHQAE